MKILVCGGRDYNNKARVHQVLEEYSQPNEEYPLGQYMITIISGMAKGADTLAADWAITNWYRLLEFPANWDKYRNAAGPIRNQQMLDEGKPDLVIAFPGNKGTADMIKRAKKAGVEVRIIDDNNKERTS